LVLRLLGYYSAFSSIQYWFKYICHALVMMTFHDKWLMANISVCHLSWNVIICHESFLINTVLVKVCICHDFPPLYIYYVIYIYILPPFFLYIHTQGGCWHHDKWGWNRTVLKYLYDKSHDNFMTNGLKVGIYIVFIGKFSQ
jgi:hypothetical protein